MTVKVQYVLNPIEEIRGNKQTWGNIYQNWKGWGMKVEEIMISKKHCSINENKTQKYVWIIQNVSGNIPQYPGYQTYHLLEALSVGHIYSALTDQFKFY